ncbi:universal stress protein [Halorubellus litoreus]|uniref:Universal stress protein n=1 Tax=Halorubellus litoreus TaxID=755308 RepID=A0ABD5VFS8_9EURY
MERGLVLVEQTVDHLDLLAEAVEHALGADADLVLLATITHDQFEDDTQMLETIGHLENTSYDTSSVLDRAVADVRSFVADEIPDDVDVTIVARATDDPGQALLDVGDEHGCDHAFVLGSHRSPTGKALFGDVAQQVALNFDGYVTLATQ